MVPVVSSSPGSVTMRVYESESLAAKSIPFIVIFKLFVKNGNLSDAILIESI